MPSSVRTSVSALNSRPSDEVGRQLRASRCRAAPCARARGPPPRTARCRRRGPAALKNGKHIAPPIRTVSARSEERLEHADLVRHLRAADDRDERPLRVLEDAVERLDLALQQPPGGGRQQVRDGLGGGVRAVRGAERVVDVDVGEPARSASPAPRRSSSRPRRSGRSRRITTSPVGDVIQVRREHDVDAEQLAQPVGGGLERELLLDALSAGRGARAGRAGRPLLAQLLQRRQRRLDASVVGDLARPRPAGR